MIKSRFLALVTALALLLAIPTAVFAQNARPHVFVGSVTLDGATAADGAAVTAWVGGEQVADTTVKNGNYDVMVSSTAGYHGETVSFKVSGVDAAESDTWQEGGGSILNLTASSSASGGGGSGEKGDSGAKGAQGPKGSTGATGAIGPAGPAGADGKAGANGKAGAAGSAGADGAAGPAGPAGAAGADGGGGALGVIALIIGIVALVAAGGAFMTGRRA